MASSPGIETTTAPSIGPLPKGAKATGRLVLALIGIAVVVGIILIYVYRTNGDLRPIANASPTSTPTPLVTPSPTLEVHQSTGSPKPTPVKTPSVPSSTPNIFATPVRSEKSPMSAAQIKQCFVKAHGSENVEFISGEVKTCNLYVCFIKMNFKVIFTNESKEDRSENLTCKR